MDQTHRVGAVLAELARPGDVVVLVGDLGAGKTALAQGVGAGLGVEERVTSPTFALVQSHAGRLRMHHLDVYRLERPDDEAADLGLSELLDEGAVTLIEWGDRIRGELPRDLLEVTITFGDGADDRVITLSPTGPRWQARCRALATALAEWADPDAADTADTAADADEDGDPC